jgi:hypothetical protein
MIHSLLLSEVLNPYVEQSGYTAGQLSKLTSIPKATLINWLNGRVQKPRNVCDLLRVAHALHLDKAETSRLLTAGGYPSIEKLMAMPGDHEQRQLLAPWAQSPGSSNGSAPFQAIADLPYFVGREREIRTLEGHLLSGEHGTIFSIQGMVGVGKTALAAHVAYRLRPCFPDGILWARLDETDPMAILSTFARAYGHDVMMYKDLASRSREVRNLLADKYALMILDNVQSSEEIQPLLPPSGPCAVMITTRRRDLTASWGTHRLNLDPFSRQNGESGKLFARFLGRDTYAQNAALLTHIADMLGHLPLAVAIVASRLAYDRDRSIPDFVQRLQSPNRLDELVIERQNIRLTFDRIFDYLPASQQQCFMALGGLSGEVFSAEMVAEALGLSFEDASDRLRELFTISLVHCDSEGRYRLHPLLRDFAREKCDN